MCIAPYGCDFRGTNTVVNPRTYHETICIMFKLFLNVVKVAFNLF